MAPYYRQIAKLIKEHCSGRQIVAFLPLIKSSQLFTEICQREGIAARHVDFKINGSSGSDAGFWRTQVPTDFQLEPSFDRLGLSAV